MLLAIDAKAYDGVTALMTAAWYGHDNIVERLFARGAAFIPSDDGRTPYDMAGISGNQHKRFEIRGW